MYAMTSNLDTLDRPSLYAWEIRSPGKREAERVRTGRRSLVASRRSSRNGVRTLLRRTAEADGVKHANEGCDASPDANCTNETERRAGC